MLIMMLADLAHVYMLNLLRQTHVVIVTYTLDKYISGLLRE